MTSKKGTGKYDQQLEEKRERYRTDPDYRTRQRAVTARNRERTASRRRVQAAKMRELKLAMGCMDCGFNAHAEALQFDHVSGPNLLAGRGFRQNADRSWKFLESEMAKCEVVCANCHAIRTANRRVKDVG